MIPRQRYERAHPDRAVLLVEVSETSLRKDLVHHGEAATTEVGHPDPPIAGASQGKR